MMKLAVAGELSDPPPLPDEPVLEQKYLREIKRNHNNFVQVTNNPNATRMGRPMDVIVYNNAGSYKLCINISSGGSGTLWRCSANALTAP